MGTSLTDDTTGVEAKLVDLDSENQSTSQIWGLKVFVGKTTSGLGFSGDYAVASFLDLFVRFTTGSADSFFGAGFQSVLQSIQWAGTGTSRYLKELSAKGIPSQLSIKFNVDGFNDDSTSSDFTLGRIVGSIGPQHDGEPSFFVAGRVLDPVPASTLNSAYAEIIDKTLTIDLGNSLNTQSPGGPFVNLGAVNLVILQPATGGAPINIGTIPYATPNWYTTTAGIVSFALSDAQLQQVSSAPLALLQPGAGNPLLLTESNDGTWVRADATVFRLNPGDTATTTYYASVFGKRASGLTISLGYDPSIMQGQTTQGPIPGPQTVGLPTSAFTFPASVTTGADGTVVVTVKAADPGQPRQYIDGQVYGVTYGPGNAPPPVGTVGNASRILNALVWSGYTAPANPTWTNDVQPILQQYADLYPVMKQFVDLSSFSSVVAAKTMLQKVFGLPTTDPLYMPVTRDLSAAKKAMILNWLNNPVQ